jgi:hypothetical protein
MDNLLTKKYENLEHTYNTFLEEYYNDELLQSHRSYIETNNLGFGEKCFHVIWRELVKQQPSSFAFLEIGVYKGQVMSLVKLLADHYNKDVKIYGVTPLSNAGDQYSNYDNVNYSEVVNNCFQQFNLDINVQDNIIKGLSTDTIIMQKVVEKGLFDIVYVDGAHDYNSVCSDIILVKKITKSGSYIIFDDSACYKNFAVPRFTGHIGVCDAVRDEIESDTSFIEVLCVGHNRIFKRL